MPASATEDDVRAAALADPKVVELLGGAEPRKVIVVPGRLVNVVLWGSPRILGEGRAPSVA